MPRNARLLAVLAVLLVAGCQAPASQPTVESSIAVDGENLSVSPDRVFADVRAVMDANVTAPDRVTVLSNASAFADRLGTDSGRTPRFYDLLGLEPGAGLNGTAFERMENGATANAGFIYILPRPDGDPASTEWVLAHEFGHYINLRLDRVATLRSALGRTTDERFARRAVREGAAVFTTDTYLARHGDQSEPTAPIYERLHDAVQPGEIARYGFSQYRFGYHYVSDRIDDPAELDSVFEKPPKTSEAVIHGYRPGTEPAKNLTVTVEASDAWREGGHDRLGEAFLRYALENGVDPDRAADAAAGWGTDRLQYLRPADGRDSSYAWVLRWDGRANATEFERTLRAYLDDRGQRQRTGWTVGTVSAAIRTPTDRTTVFLLGDSTLVTDTVVTARSSAHIRLRLPDAGGN